MTRGPRVGGIEDQEPRQFASSLPLTEAPEVKMLVAVPVPAKKRLEEMTDSIRASSKVLRHITLGDVLATLVFHAPNDTPELRQWLLEYGEALVGDFEFYDRVPPESRAKVISFPRHPRGPRPIRR